MTRLVGLALIAFFISGVPAMGETPRTVTWEDLVPKDAEYPEDPMLKLSVSQQADVGFIVRARSVVARTELGDSGLAMEAEERKKELLRQGINVDALIARMREVEAAWRDADEKVEPTLDGKLIRLPGYILPLEFAGSKVVEFLLVPFVGACVHVPPPPPNQIVHVRYKEGFDATGLFTPVQIVGRLKTSGLASKSMFLQDGNVNVSYGYSMQANGIELYKEEENKP